MKQILFIFTSLLLISCGEKQKETHQAPKAETPKALQEGNLLDMEIKSYNRSSYGTNLVDELYDEIVEKTPALQKLETGLEELDKAKAAPLDLFKNYDHKSANYYSDANYKMEGIRDSVLKNKMLLLIKQSSSNYNVKKSELENLISIIEKKDIMLNDYHLVLKLSYTMSLMEKYQTDNLPDKKNFKEHIKKQQSTYKAMDSLSVLH